MRKFRSIIVYATVLIFMFSLSIILVGCTSTEEKLEVAHEIYDAESFVINTIDTVGGKGQNYQRIQTDDYVIYEIYYYKGTTKYWIDENGYGVQDSTILKAKYSVADYIDYMFGYGKYREDDSVDYSTTYYNNVYYDNTYYYDSDDDDDDYYYYENDYDDDSNYYYDSYYYDDDVYYYYDDDDYYYEDYYDYYYDGYDY